MLLLFIAERSFCMIFAMSLFIGGSFFPIDDHDSQVQCDRLRMMSNHAQEAKQEIDKIFNIKLPQVQ